MLTPEMEAGQADGRHNVANPQRVSRRSIRSGSEVRHGRVYQDPTDASVRAVTPDSALSATFGIAEHEALQTPPPQLRPYQAQDGLYGKETSASVSNTDEEGTTDIRHRKGQKKPKVRGDVSADASPKSFITKTRRRLGSITTSAQVAGQQADTPGSSGHHSVPGSVTFPNLAEVRTQLPKIPRRTFSSDTATSILRSPLFVNTDSSKILQLMKTTCGRMHGILFFRPLGTSAWESGYCAINVSSGSLVCQNQGEPSSAKTLLPDLRGCSVRTNYDSESQSTFISIVLPSTGLGCQIRPPVPETFDSWLAALLCWQPLQPKGLHNKMIKANPVTMTEKRPIGSRRLSDMSIPRSTAIVKVGRMLLWDGPLPAGSQRHLSKRNSDFDTITKESSWRRVSCTLHENGTFKLLTEIDPQTICSVRLSQLARCAVQRLDTSILDAPHCLAIYPQYTVNSTRLRSSNPLVLALESQNAYEAWYVLLRALTAPELYGPEKYDHVSSASTTDLSQRDDHIHMFRIERSLAIKITEAKLHRDLADPAQGSQGTKVKRNFSDVDVYADVVLGRDLRARTTQKSCSQSAFWAEGFFLPDLPPLLSTISVSVRVGSPAEQEWTMVALDAYELASPDLSQVPGLTGVEIISNDPDFGKVDIQMDELEQEKAIEKWWQLLDKHGRVVGSLLMKLTLSETIVLMESEYKQMSTILHTFDNGLTTQMAHILSRELKQLSEVLLDIFQTSDTASEWINTLIEEEIDGIYKETPPMRMRFSARIHSNDSYESAEQRELLVRDLSRSATMEANLLFRGNSLVTKALDAHMRRLGKQYLENTLGEQLRAILRRNPDCEVDPVRIRSQDHMDRNWSTLMSLTNEVWRAISSSAARCPPGMRVMFKHIRSCAEDRYGSFIRTVKYTSVSGFLFLRFFCPAILNPKLFGLIEDHPPDRARRTFTLIAKSLNVLASMAKFGTKETWMEPMNKFLVAATPEFKSFVEAAPMQIRARLTQTVREGLPILPYLLDAPRSLATLVDLWIDYAPNNIAAAGVDDPMTQFHNICLELRRRTKDCMTKAEMAEKTHSNQEAQWQQILNSQQQRENMISNPFDDSFSGLSTETDITALPQRGDAARIRPIQSVQRSSSAGATVTLSSSAPPLESRRMPYTVHHAGDNPSFVSSTNSSTISFDNPDDGRNDGRRLPSSRDGSSKARLLDHLKPLRKKTKSGYGGERASIEQEHDYI